MKILTAEWLFDGAEISKRRAVAFKERIEAVGTAEELKAKYPKAEVVEGDERSVLMPGLINPHLHLEFGANRTELRYGDFMEWLQSVIKRRDDLVERCAAGCYRRQIGDMLSAGITSFGAVSSYGLDLKACKSAPQRVVYFNEAIGSQPAAVDALYADFMQRVEESEKLSGERFIPGVAIHSPYSVHPILIKKILSGVGDMPLSAHFMESPAEKEWLESGSGPFKHFFENFLNQSTPLCFPEEFLQLIESKRTLLTHVVQADDRLLEMIAEAGHTVTHCPRSNRLLGCGRLRLEKIEQLQIRWLLGTDGLSSNTSLSLWDEMRSALMLHHLADANLLAKKLLKASTSAAAEALGIEAGRICRGNYADMIMLKLPSTVDSPEDLPLQLILHTTEPEIVYIDGKRRV
ncbi:BOX elements [Hydrogenimonas sp.]|nr:BOX elements [Hydrogenimonas sp.]